MSAAIRGEIAKIRTTRLLLILALVAVGLAALSAAADSYLATHASQLDPTGRLTISPSQVLAAAGGVSPVVLVMGVITMTAEYRWRTISDTFLAVPRRWVVVAAKLVTAAALGLLIGVVAVAVTSAIALPWFGLSHVPLPAASHVLAQDARIVLGLGLYGAIGVAVGSLITNQIAAISLVLVWSALAESLVVALLPAVGKWLPGGAFNAITGAGGGGGLTATGSTAHLLPVWAGAAVLAGYAVLLAAVASLITVRRDVT